MILSLKNNRESTIANAIITSIAALLRLQIVIVSHLLRQLKGLLCIWQGRPLDRFEHGNNSHADLWKA
jgi:hypothetical protein